MRIIWLQNVVSDFDPGGVNEMFGFFIGVIVAAVVLFLLVNNSGAIMRKTKDVDLKKVDAPVVMDDSAEKEQMRENNSEFATTGAVANSEQDNQTEEDKDQ